MIRCRRFPKPDRISTSFGRARSQFHYRYRSHPSASTTRTSRSRQMEKTTFRIAWRIQLPRSHGGRPAFFAVFSTHGLPASWSVIKMVDSNRNNTFSEVLHHSSRPCHEYTTPTQLLVSVLSAGGTEVPLITPPLGPVAKFKNRCGRCMNEYESMESQMQSHNSLRVILGQIGKSI